MSFLGHNCRINNNDGTTNSYNYIGNEVAAGAKSQRPCGIAFGYYTDNVNGNGGNIAFISGSLRANNGFSSAMPLKDDVGMLLKYDGKLGIATNNPVNSLDIRSTSDPGIHIANRDNTYNYSITTSVGSSSNGSLHFKNNGTEIMRLQNNGDLLTERIFPLTDNTYDLGASSYRWDDIFATNSTIQTSDRNLKEDISGSTLGLEFINKLNPVSYKFKNKVRTHYGLIAQDVKDVLISCGMDFSGNKTNEFAGYIYNEAISDDTSDEYENIKEFDLSGNLVSVQRKISKPANHSSDESFGLRYSEFISPIIKAIQELSQENETLKTENTDIKARLAAIEAQLGIS